MVSLGPECTFGRQHELFVVTAIYLDTCALLIEFLLQQLVIYETSASELDIIRDISRTFPSHVFFQQRHGPGQRSLYNVLKAYSVYDRDVGYVQVRVVNNGGFIFTTNNLPKHIKLV